MNLNNTDFKVGDKVILDGCPFDEQIADDLLEYIEVKDQVQVVTRVRRVTEEGTSGQWIQTNSMPNWTDKAWFKRAE